MNKKFENKRGIVGIKSGISIKEIILLKTDGYVWAETPKFVELWAEKSTFRLRVRRFPKDQLKAIITADATGALTYNSL